MLSVSTWNYLKCYGDKASLEENLSEIKKQGFGVEFWLDWTADQTFFRRSNWEHIKEICIGIPKFSAHTKMKKKFSMEVLLEELDFCAFIGADPLVCHPLSFGLQTGTWDFESGLILSSKEKILIGRILSEASKRSIRIALENGPMDILLQVIAAMADHPASKSLGICIDTGHANMHHSLIDSPVTEIIKKLKHHLIHLHVHDNGGQLDDHQIPGEGSTNWQEVFSLLQSFGYNEEIVFELNTNDPKTASEKAGSFVKKILIRK
ncbi:MAG: sugar phosphate isomerase/epimerase [Spirochaetia bacterium]|nr:sugar phosphate isomerase/epimerase [Spirochaetia bacterium]